MALYPSCFIRAAALPLELSIAQMLEELGWEPDANILDKLLALDKLIRECDLALDPPIGMGDLLDVRILKKMPTSLRIGDVKEFLLAGETPTVEFKSTLVLDLNKAKFNPEISDSECKSDEVTFSSMKTVCAFLNSGGGTLFLGVSDAGEPLGLKRDIAIYPRSKADFDTFDLHFRACVVRSFCEGELINRHIAISPVQIDEDQIAKISISSRSKITFMKSGENRFLYLRIGNRSIPVKFEEVEEYFNLVRR